jgi:hypothetical protein
MSKWYDDCTDTLSDLLGKCKFSIPQNENSFNYYNSNATATGCQEGDDNCVGGTILSPSNVQYVMRKRRETSEFAPDWASPYRCLHPKTTLELKRARVQEAIDKLCRADKKIARGTDHTSLNNTEIPELKDYGELDISAEIYLDDTWDNSNQCTEGFDFKNQAAIDICKGAMKHILEKCIVLYVLSAHLYANAPS